jgi:hypothetical protein
MVEILERDLPWRVVSKDQKKMAKGWARLEDAQADRDERNARARELGTVEYIVIERPKVYVTHDEEEVPGPAIP